MNESKRRENGFGTLINKGQGKPWLAKWVYNGKTHYKSTGETDKRKALKELERLTRPYREESDIAVLKNLEAKIKTAEATRTTYKLRMRLDELAAAYSDCLYAKDLVDGSLKNYMTIINKLVSWLKSNTNAKYMDEVTSSDATKYLNELSERLGATTYNINLVFFKKLWTIFKDEATLSSNIWEKFKKRKASSHTSRRPLTSDEVMKLMVEVKDDPDLSVLFAIGIYTGLRLSDCCLLKWENIDMHTRIISVVPIKTKRHLQSPIEIPIHQTLYSILCRMHTPISSGYVSPKNAKAYKSSKISSTLSDVFTKCGIKTKGVDEAGRTKLLCGFHSLRHTFVSLNINSGMSPLLIQKIVGHSTVDMTEHYFHSNQKVIADGISKMPDFVGHQIALPCPQGADDTLDDESIRLLKECYDTNRDKSLSDTLKRIAKAHINVVDAA